VKKMTVREGRVGSTPADRGTSCDEVVVRAEGVDTAVGQGAVCLKPHRKRRAAGRETPS
jgi:hypothetical protein